jgi:hypothetical protein
MEPISEFIQESNKLKIIKLLESTRRKNIESLLSYVTETDYFIAPASSKLEHHAAYKGGLAFHSLNVYELFNEKCERYSIDLPHEERIISALCHDLCKINFYEKNILKDGTQSKDKPYNVCEQVPLGHGEVSLYRAGKIIELTPQEEMLIRWHMGQFDGNWENNSRYVREKCPTIALFQNSDIEASRYLE